MPSLAFEQRCVGNIESVERPDLEEKERPLGRAALAAHAHSRPMLKDSFVDPCVLPVLAVGRAEACTGPGDGFPVYEYHLELHLMIPDVPCVAHKAGEVVDEHIAGGQGDILRGWLPLFTFRILPPREGCLWSELPTIELGAH